MKASAERIEKNTVLLKVEVDSEQYSKEISKAYREIVKKIDVPGFRKGKTPKHILERFVGKEAMYEEALEKVVNEAYFEAVKDTGIEPVDQPQVDIKQAEEGKPVLFEATVMVKPDVELGQYKGIEVTRSNLEVTDEDVEKELERMQNDHAQMVNIEEGAVQLEDETIIDFVGRITGEEFDGGKSEMFPLTIGSGRFIKGFEEQMIGMAINETREINVTFPEDYIEAKVAGKDVVFTVTLHSIKRKELAPIDDEFAKDVSDFETLEELKTDVRNKLIQVTENRIGYMKRKELIDKVVDNATVEIPESMVERQSRELFNSITNNFANQGVSISDYMAYTNTTVDKMRDEMRPEAERNVKTTLVIEAIGKAEGLAPTEEEIQEEVERYAKIYGQTPEEFREQMKQENSMDFLLNSIIKEKTFKFLVDNSVEVDPPPEEEKAPEEETAQENA